MWILLKPRQDTHPQLKINKKVQEVGGVEAEMGRVRPMKWNRTWTEMGLDHGAVGEAMGCGSETGLEHREVVDLGCGAMANCGDKEDLGHGTEEDMDCEATVKDQGTRTEPDTRVELETKVEPAEQVTSAEPENWAELAEQATREEPETKVELAEQVTKGGARELGKVG